VSLRRKGRRLRMFENSVLRRIFGSRRGEVTGERRKLLIVELMVLYTSTNIILLMQLKKMRWAVHVERMVKRRVVYRDLMGKLRERDHLGDLGEDVWIILRWIFRK